MLNVMVLMVTVTFRVSAHNARKQTVRNSLLTAVLSFKRIYRHFSLR